MQNNSGYKPVQKKQVVIFIANFDDMQKSKSGLYLGTEDEVFNRLSRLREGTIVEITEGCFEDFHIKPKVGDKISFKDYSGSIFEKDKDYYRIFEDKHITAIVE